MRRSRWIRRLAVVAAAGASGLVGTACGPPPPVLHDVGVPEQGGPAVFLFNLGTPAPGPLALRYFTGDVTATAPADYTATSGTLTFAAGETSKTVSVPVVDDALDEGDESFGLGIADGGTILAAAFATVADDDPMPTVALASRPTFVEGNVGTSGGGTSFRLELSAASGRPVDVWFGTSDGFGGQSPAKAPADYTATATRAVFAPGATSISVPVPIVGDTLDEPREAFTATLSDPSFAMLGDVTRTPGVIADDDDSPSVIISDASVPERVGALGFRVRLSAPSGRPTSVAYATRDGTAADGEDYDATSGTLRWTTGTTTEWIVSVPVSSDSCREANETVLLDLSSPEFLALPDPSGQGTIVDDDLFMC